MSVTVSGLIASGDHDAGIPATFTNAQANFANANFVMIAEYLGLPAGDGCDLSGSWDAHDVKARCLLSRAVGGNLSDDGMPAAETGGPGTGFARMIDCGLRPGYFFGAVRALEAIADECIARGSQVLSYG